MMGNPVGYLHPKSATGNASILPAPPWHYSGDLLTVTYRTDPAEVAELLPPGVELASADPDVVSVVWAYWQSCSDGGAELLDPGRAQYQEAMALVRCSYQGRTYHRCAFIWVDRDFALVRGMVQGYPKKFGDCYLTRPYPYGAGAPRLAPGERFGGTVTAGGRRLCEAVVQVREAKDRDEYGYGSLPLLQSRLMPSIESSSALALDELVVTRAASAEGGPVWAGTATLHLFESPTEDLARLEVREVIGGSFRQAGMTWDGATVLARGAGQLGAGQVPALPLN